jgi:hypothetical protein
MAVGAGGYAAAITGVADLMTGASADAAYDIAYGQYYSAFAGMHNAANQRSAAEANIAAIKQDRINTNVVIAMKQDQAEAQAKVAAAVSGVEGQSVNDVIYQTEVNSSVAQSNNRKNAEQQIENQLASIYQSTSTMLALDGTYVSTPSLAMSLGNSAAAMVGMGADLMDGMDGLFGVDSTADVAWGDDAWGNSSGNDILAINYQQSDMSVQLA